MNMQYNCSEMYNLCHVSHPYSGERTSRRLGILLLQIEAVERGVFPGPEAGSRRRAVGRAER